MEISDFTTQVERLSNQWPNSYGKERNKVLWRTFRSVSGTAFTDAISDCLGNCRQAPLIKELEKSVADCETREKQSRYQRQHGNALVSVFESAAKKSSNPELAKACVAAVKFKVDKNPSEAEWNEVMSYIDKLARPEARQ